MAGGRYGVVYCNSLATLEPIQPLQCKIVVAAQRRYNRIRPYLRPYCSVLSVGWP